VIPRTIRRVAFVFPVLAAVPVALAAPGPRERPTGPIYAPTAVGDRLVYDAFGTEITETVTAITEDGRARVVTTEGVAAGRGSVGESRLRVAPDGVFRVAAAGPDDPPHCLLRLPAVAGTKWEYEVRPGGGRPALKGMSVVAGEEEVAVPAGKYKAVRVDSEHPGPGGRPVRSTAWYAASVGMVKTVYGADKAIVLKSFTPGKK
jgi:hypothetical protein